MNLKSGTMPIGYSMRTHMKSTKTSEEQIASALEAHTYAHLPMLELRKYYSKYHRILVAAHS